MLRCHKKKDVIDFVRFYKNIEPKQAAELLVSLLPQCSDVDVQEQPEEGRERGVSNEPDTSGGALTAYHCSCECTVCGRNVF